MSRKNGGDDTSPSFSSLILVFADKKNLSMGVIYKSDKSKKKTPRKMVNMEQTILLL